MSQGCTWINVITAGEVTEPLVDPASTGANCSKWELSVEKLYIQIERMALRLDEFDNPSPGDNTFEVTYDDLGVLDWIEFDLASVIDEEISLRATFTVLR